MCMNFEWIPASSCRATSFIQYENEIVYHIIVSLREISEYETTQQGRCDGSIRTPVYATLMSGWGGCKVDEMRPDVMNFESDGIFSYYD